jgi:hypothetical protein
MVKKKKFALTTLLIIALLSVGTVLLLINEQKNKIQETEVKGDTVETCQEYEEEISIQLEKLSLIRNWYLKSNYVEQKEINIQLELPEDRDIKVEYLLDDTVLETENSYSLSLPVDSLETGEHRINVNIENCSNTYSQEKLFNVSQPVYVVWSIDWEGFDVKQEYLDQMAQISSKYNAPMTHFFNPYIYLYLNQERSAYLTNWVKQRNESIGLHLHMYSKLVSAAGVQVNNSIAWGSPTGNGHDTPNTTYNYNEYTKIIDWSIKQFEKNELNRPTMYRAGGWFIDEENLRVLNDLEFTLDTSGRTSYVHGRNQLVGEWSLKSTTQPYQLNSTDQNITSNPNMNLWEYPNNGGDSWAYTSEKLIERFRDNYIGGISTQKKVVTYVTHPHWFDKEGPNIEGTLKYINTMSYGTDSGPILFISLDNVHKDIVKL